MKTIIRGSIVFLIWSVLCTYYYVKHTSRYENEAPPAIVQTVEEPAPLEKAVPIPVSPGSFTVFHDFNRNEFIPNPQFDNFIKKVDSYKTQKEAIEIKVVGHADYIGPEDYNSRLGLQRAAFVKKYLVGKGFNEKDITISSKGESAPVATNETKEGRTKNRRTEVEITN